MRLSDLENGLRAGLGNADETAKCFLRGLPSQWLSFAATSTLESAFPTLFAGGLATRGEFVADRPALFPALFPAGEHGPERVSVTPNQPGMGPGGGGGGGDPVSIVLKFSGGSAGLDPQQIKRMVKAAYLEAANESARIRRVNASQVRRSL